jgi:amidase
MRRTAAKIAASRRSFLKTTLIGGATATLIPLYPAIAAAREIAFSLPVPEITPFELDEITISDLQDGMKSGKFTAHSLVEKYSARVDEIDKQGPAINSIIELNPDALSIAEALDQECTASQC